jgi:hypothetical protein
MRGHLNQLRGGFRTRVSRFTGDRIGRINGLMLTFMGNAQVKYGRARTTLGKGLGKLSFS